MGVLAVAALGRELSRSTHGVVSAAELRAAGVDLTVARRLVRRGEWRLLWRGMFLTAATDLGPLVLAHAAVKHAGQRHTGAAPAPRAVLSGLAGARALGLRWVPTVERAQVLVGPAVRRESNDHVLVRRTADVAAIETWSWGGVPVADAARLVVDGARECASLRDVRGLVLGAVADRHTSAQDVVDLLARGAVGGTAWARRAARDAERGAASPPEAELVDDLLGGGLPFWVNPELRVHGRFVASPDVYLAGTGVGGEMDSREWHEQDELLDDTLLRHERADTAGLTLVHTTPGRYRRDPGAFHARLLRAVQDNRRRGVGDPAKLEVLPRGPLLH